MAKRVSLYQDIYALDNLYLASKKAQKGKRSNNAVARFWLYEDRELLQMHHELKSKSYRFGGYRKFIYADKGIERRISVAPFRDRVLHHAIMNQIEPLFQKRFIHDSYANQKRKGTLKALKRARYYANRHRYVLQLDIRKFFPSIDHDILFSRLARKIACQDTLALLKALIANSNRQDDAFFYFAEDTLFTPFERKKGIPLGNLTSQFFGNLYLDPFDHYLKEVLGVKGYIRYVDDLCLFADSKEELLALIRPIEEYLARLRLKLHPDKTKLSSTQEGFVFLSHRIYPTHFYLTSKAIRRSRRSLKKVRYDYAYHKIDLPQAKNRIFGTVGFLRMGSNYKVSDELLMQTVLRRR